MQKDTSQLIRILDAISLRSTNHCFLAEQLGVAEDYQEMILRRGAAPQSKSLGKMLKSSNQSSNPSVGKAFSQGNGSLWHSVEVRYSISKY